MFKKYTKKAEKTGCANNRATTCLLFVVIFYACLTQSVEYRFCKPKVIGSTPIASFKNKNYSKSLH